MTSPKRLACVDLFCGAGGLTHGLVEEGISVLAGVDLDPACKYPYEANNGSRFIECDVACLTGSDLHDLFGEAEIRVLAGCAPCQPFSSYSQRYDTKDTDRWRLLREFERLMRETQPEIVTMENVPQVIKHSVFSDFVAALRELDYEVWHDDVDCSEYGLAQRRRRHVLLASRMGPIKLMGKTGELRTVNEAFDGLRALGAGESDPNDRLHVSAGLSRVNLKRIRHSKPGGTWRDWPEDLRSPCHRKDSGQTYSSVYGRINGDEPSPTLTTQFYGYGSGRFGHPTQDRALTLREGAILQGFPRDYEFVPEGIPVQIKTLGRLIGNAVPVILGKVIGKSILHHLATG